MGSARAEAVDALLHVPHGEEVLPVPGHRLEDGVLDLVGVLVLVHQDLPVPGRHLLPQLRGGAVGPTSSPRARCSWSEKSAAFSRSFSCRYRSAKSSVSRSRATMAGATARRSSMASSPVTERTRCSFFVSSLHRSHTCFSAATAGSSFRPLGVESRGNATAAAALPGLLPGPDLPQGGKGGGGHQEFLPVAPVQRLVPLRPSAEEAEQAGPVGPLPADGGQQLGGIGGVVKGAGPAPPRRSGSPPASPPGPRGSGPCRTAPAPGRPGGCRPGRRPGCPPAGRRPASSWS